jgi:hypothetical protein
MRLKPISILLVFWMIFLTACASIEPTPDAGASTTAVPTEAVSADNAKEAYPGAVTTTDNTNPYPGADTANSSDSIDLGYPAPDPTTGEIPVLQPTTRFKVPEVDRILDILLANKGADLTAQLIYEQVACSTAGGKEAPKCADGETDGTKLEVLPVTGGETSFLRKNDTSLKALPGNVELLGVFKVRPEVKAKNNFPLGTYGVVVRSKTDNKQIINLRITANGVVRVDYLSTPPDFGQIDLANYLKPAK